MPSATAKKIEIEKPEIENVTPVRQSLLIIEHKIRNLEKRKGKLDSYKDLKKSGKDLSADQKAAVSKYDEVTTTLDLAREFFKQIQGVAVQTEKDLKKTAKRDAVIRAQQDTAKVREVLIVQDTLKQFSSDAEIREDFLSGINGAVKLEVEDIELLEKFHEDVTIKRSSELPLNQTVHKVAEHFTSAIDGRTKVYGTTTYEKIRQILQSVQQSGYFEKKFNPEIIEEQQEQQTIEIVEESDEIASDNQIEEVEFIEEQDSNDVDVVVLEIVEQQPIEQVLTPPQQIPLQNVLPPQQQQQQQPQQQPPQLQQLQQQPIVAAVPANQIHTTVRAVEQTFYKQHQYIQQMRPITEVIGTGSFFFLQESELDTPDQFPAGGNGFQPQQQQHPQLQQQQQQQQQQPPLQQQPHYQPNPSQIPTQTYTNQNFKTVVPPQPIYPGIKNNEINNSVQQHNIPGFASNNSPVPVITAQLPPQQVIVQSSPQLIAPIPIPGFISPQQQQQYSQQQLSQSKPQINEITNSPPQQQQHQQQQQHPKEIREKHDPQINPSLEWNPNDAAIVTSSATTTNKKQQQQQHQNNDSLEWSDPSGNDDVKEWKMSDGQADNGSNTWSNDNQNDNYGNRNNNYRGNNRNNGGNRLGGSGGGGSGGGYRGRSNNSYNQSSNQGRGSSNGGSGTFYRNNDNNYYQNQNGGNGGYNNRSEGGYRNGGDSYKPRGGTGGQNRNNNDRNSPGHDQQRDQQRDQRPRTNNTASNNNRRGGGGNTGGSMPGERPQGNAGYRGGQRPATTTPTTNQPKQTVNAN